MAPSTISRGCLLLGCLLMEEKYRLRFFFEWGVDSCFWAGNDKAYDRYGVGDVDLEELPLSPATADRIQELAGWYYTALNWDYPPDPGPWRQEECDRFNLTVKELLAIVQAELGDSYELVSSQDEIMEDPELDEYLLDPQGFVRKRDRDT